MKIALIIVFALGTLYVLAPAELTQLGSHVASVARPAARGLLVSANSKFTEVVKAARE
jgi:hypothetical protein